MWLKAGLNLSTSIVISFGIMGLFSTTVSAQNIKCPNEQSDFFRKVCQQQYQTLRESLQNQHLAAFLVTDAPIKLIQDTQNLWVSHANQCKSKQCIQQQLEYRIDDLNFYTSINQSLTQHYLKYDHGKLIQNPIHLQIHQLGKDKIKIEGRAYRNPNNRIETQHTSFLAYTDPEHKTEITDNENDCKYQFQFQKTILKVSTEQKGCERFSGIYRLYD